MEKKEHIISLLVKNEPDVLSRIAGALGGKGYNIESLCVNATADYKISKIVLTTRGNAATLNRIEKLLNKLIDVIQVDIVDADRFVQKELTLAKIKISEEFRSKLAGDIDSHKWKVVWLNGDYLIVEVTADKDEMDQILSHLSELGMVDYTRTGTIVVER
ncbi:MAG: acetolactate synthase small subunit [Syntrophaceae bacterium]|nr:acetolactate synthase small subunit [Syntrophaceae bacterium]